MDVLGWVVPSMAPAPGGHIPPLQSGLLLEVGTHGLLGEKVGVSMFRASLVMDGKEKGLQGQILPH